jgi:hypothetical protein
MTCINAVLILRITSAIRGELRIHYLPEEQSHHTGNIHADDPQ